MKLKTNKPASWINYFIAAFIIAIPFVSSASLLDPTLLSRHLAFAFFSVTAGVFLFFYSREIRDFNPGLIFYGYFFLFLFYIPGLFIAQNKVEAVYWFSKISLYFSFYLIFYLLFKNEILRIKIFNRTVLIFVALSLVLLIIETVELSAQNINLFKDKNLYSLSTAYGHKNLYSSIVLLSLPFVFQVVFKDNKNWKMLAIIVSSLAVLSVFFLQTKSVLLAIVIGFIASLVSLLIFAKNEFPGILKWVTSSFFLGILIIGVIAFINPGRFEILLAGDTFQERLLVWRNTISMIREFPLWGAGGGNWQIYFPKYGLADFEHGNYMVSWGFQTFQRPHNDFLWIWSEAGIFAILAYLAIFVGVLFRLVKTFFNAGDFREKLLSVVLFFGLVSYSVVAFFDFPFERNEHQFLFAALTGLIAASKNNGALKGYGKIPAKLIVPAIILMGAFSFFIGVKRFVAEQSMLRVHIAHYSQNWPALISEARSAETGFFNMDNFSIPVAWYRGLAKFNSGDDPGAKLDFEKAYSINPYQVHVINNLAGMHEKAGNRLKAIELYDEVLGISPAQRDALLNKSAALFNLGRKQEAFNTIYLMAYDQWNEQYLLFLRVITVAYLEEMTLEKNDPDLSAKVNVIKDDDAQIKNLIEKSKNENLDLLQALKLL